MPGFHHDHVGAFIEIECHLAQGFVGIGGIHLVRPLVAMTEAGGGSDGIAEWSVESRCVLGGVGHDGDTRMSCVIECPADGANPAIHHVARRNDVTPGFSLD